MSPIGTPSTNPGFVSIDVASHSLSNATIVVTPPSFPGLSDVVPLLTNSNPLLAASTVPNLPLASPPIFQDVIVASPPPTTNLHPMITRSPAAFLFLALLIRRRESVTPNASPRHCDTVTPSVSPCRLRFRVFLPRSGEKRYLLQWMFLLQFP
ncbi:hypothetical protein J5N97_011329 [Dioscorea zingiberensis]|uniref:Uncharacterized protein n=1 Tax=Dioscorea zingiberensis TaxID=325984 RepID=A0A9D5HNE8_9LILI|nr:hypothetical protein J5N97_011329 [Dioscorea zingiberensis]